MAIEQEGLDVNCEKALRDVEAFIIDIETTNEPVIFDRSSLAVRLTAAVRILENATDRDLSASIDTVRKAFQIIEGRGCNEIESAFYSFLTKHHVFADSKLWRQNNEAARVAREYKQYGHMLPEIDRVIIYPEKVTDETTQKIQRFFLPTPYIIKRFTEHLGITPDSLKERDIRSVVEFGGSINLYPEYMEENGITWTCVDPASSMIGQWGKLIESDVDQRLAEDSDHMNDRRRARSEPGIWEDALHCELSLLEAEAKKRDNFAEVYYPPRKQFTDLAQRINPELHLASDAEKTGLPDAGCDLVVASKFIHSLYDEYQAEAADRGKFIRVINEARRILKPDGSLVFYPVLIHFLQEEFTDHIKRISPGHWQLLIEKYQHLPEPDLLHIKGVHTVEQLKNILRGNVELDYSQLADPESLFTYFNGLSRVTESVLQNK